MKFCHRVKSGKLFCFATGSNLHTMFIPGEEQMEIDITADDNTPRPFVHAFASVSKYLAGDISLK